MILKLHACHPCFSQSAILWSSVDATDVHDSAPEAVVTCVEECDAHCTRFASLPSCEETSDVSPIKTHPLSESRSYSVSTAMQSPRVATVWLERDVDGSQEYT